MAEVPTKTFKIGHNNAFDLQSLSQDTEAFEVSEDNTRFSVVDGIVYNKAQDTLIAIPPQKKEIRMLPHVTNFAPELSRPGYACNHLWYSCQATTIIFPEGMIEIPAGIAPKLNVTNSLEEIKLPKGIKYIGKGAFAHCKKLRVVELPDTLISIGDEAFNDCEALEVINIPDSVETIGNDAFRGCKSIKQVNIPASIQEIGTNAFNGCRGLQGCELVFPISLMRIGGGAFNGTHVKSLEFKGIPKSLGTGSDVATDGAGLQKITIPNGSVKEFGKLIGFFSRLFRYPTTESVDGKFITLLVAAEGTNADYENKKAYINPNCIAAIDVSKDGEYYFIYTVGNDKPYKVKRVNCIDWINRFID